MLDSTIMEDAAAPPEVLIPEARDRQRRRYRRSAVLVSIVALVLGLVLALVITATSSGSGTARPTPKPIATLAASGTTVLVRPVLCYAPSYEATASSGSSTALPACGAPYLLTATALDVTPAHNGFVSKGGTPDPALARYPSNSSDAPNQTVLLGGPGEYPFGATRAVLGPSELRLSTTDVRSVLAQKAGAFIWDVTIHLTPDGAAAWDRVAQENFHQFLAIDIGGKIVNTFLVQPSQASFSSFDGKVVVSGNLTATAAQSIASAVKG
jgi:hypothetical protein